MIGGNNNNNEQAIIINVTSPDTLHKRHSSGQELSLTADLPKGWHFACHASAQLLSAGMEDFGAVMLQGVHFHPSVILRQCKIGVK